MANAELNRLRAEARARHKAATRKASRLRAQGIEVTGSAIDPRRSPKSIGRYNAAQLQVYIKSLNQFVSRSNQYVPAEGKVPMARTQWQEYKRLEALMQAKARVKMGELGKHKLPGSMTTVDERINAMSPNFPSYTDFSGTTPQRVPNLSSKAVHSPQALDKLIRSMRKKLKPGYYPSLVKRGRTSARKMLIDIGEIELVGALEKLSDKQFEILWTYSPFAASLNINYQYAKALMSKGAQAMDDSVLTNELDNAKDLAAWAKNI